MPSGINFLIADPKNKERARKEEQVILIIVIDINGIFILFVP